MKLLFLLFQLLILGFSQVHLSTNKQLNGFIMITHSGDVDKPYPVIVFNSLGKVDSIFREAYICKINVPESEFNSLDKTIRGSQMITKTHSPSDLIEIRILTSEKDEWFFLNSKEVINVLFKQIIGQFDDVEKRKKASNSLYSLLNRLPPYGVFNAE